MEGKNRGGYGNEAISIQLVHKYIMFGLEIMSRLECLNWMSTLEMFRLEMFTLEMFGLENVLIGNVKSNVR